MDKDTHPLIAEDEEVFKSLSDEDLAVLYADTGEAWKGAAVEKIAVPIEEEEEHKEEESPESYLPDIHDLFEEGTKVSTSAVKSRDPLQEYSRTPLTPDQYKRFPHTVKMGKVIAKAYDLATESGMLGYNEYLSGLSDGTDSPSIIPTGKPMIKETDTGWKVLVHYQEVWYKSVLR